MSQWTSATLADARYFEYLNGLWKGKNPPFEKAIVIRNTNFGDDGVLDLSDVAVLDVESKQLERRRLKQGDIIIERSGGGPKQPVGRACFFNIETPQAHSFSNFTTTLRVHDTNAFLPRFVHYCLLHLYNTGFTIPLQRATTGIRNLDFTAYREAEIPKPSKREQEKIAAVLLKVQRAIEVEEKLIATARELKHSAMRQLFTHGLRNEPQKETEIGPVPESWDVQPIRANAKLISGGTPSRTNKEFWDGGTIPWVKTGEVNYCVINDTEEKITPAGFDNSPVKLMPKGTLLIAMYGQGITRGKVALLGIEATTNQACGGIIPTSDKVLPKYLYHFLTFSYDRLRSLSHGAQQQNLNAELVAGFEVALPGGDEQREIAAILETIDRKISVHGRKRATLQELFKTLLHQLVTGAIRVADLDIDVSEVQTK